MIGTATEPLTAATLTTPIKEIAVYRQDFEILTHQYWYLQGWGEPPNLGGAYKRLLKEGTINDKEYEWFKSANTLVNVASHGKAQPVIDWLRNDMMDLVWLVEPVGLHFIFEDGPLIKFQTNDQADDFMDKLANVQAAMNDLDQLDPKVGVEIKATPVPFERSMILFSLRARVGVAKKILDYLYLVLQDRLHPQI